MTPILPSEPCGLYAVTCKLQVTAQVEATRGQYAPKLLIMRSSFKHIGFNTLKVLESHSGKGHLSSTLILPPQMSRP